MYLSDNEITNRLEDINIECDKSTCDYDCINNIQPASIDLCLSNVFWEPIKKNTIDLRKSSLLELSPRRYWKKRILRESESITLKPGKLLLGRLASKLTIPNDCAGKIVGRSSFARLGLTIHCTGNFINPGYRGHMPLQLYNHSPNPIKIFPYIPICQVIFIKLSSTPQKLYGVDELYSKYMDDDGGPSYWWRDKRIQSLQKAFSERSIELYVQEEILNKIGVNEPEIIERFEHLIRKKPDIANENADFLIDEFTKTENKLKKKDMIFDGLSKVLFPIFCATSLSIAITEINSIMYWHYLIWALTLISLIPFIKALKDPPKKYLETKEISISDIHHKSSHKKE